MAITTVQRDQIITLVVGMFNAAPGAQYLSLLADSVEDGATIQQLATALATRPEFATVYPSFQTSTEFANSLVANLLGSEVSAAATTWSTNWVVAQINAGMSKAQVIVTALTAISTTTNPAYADAQAALANKVEVATHYSVTLGLSSTDLDDLQAVIEGVTSDDDSVDEAIGDIEDNSGGIFNLTVGADTPDSTGGSDVFNALSVGTDGLGATTLSAFDVIDGGAGTDTLEIYTNGAFNSTMPASASVKNVEIVNIYNEAAAGAFGNASKFQGVQQLWQHNAAVAVTQLASSTTAGFKGIDASKLSVTGAAGAASVTVALDDVDDASELSISGAALTTVNVSGAVVAAAPPAAVKSIMLDVNQSATATTVTVNTSVASTLSFDAGKLAAVDASASTGAINYDSTGFSGVGSIKTGAAKDTLILATKTSSTLAAVVDSGAGDDSVTANVSGTGTTTITTGLGMDTVVVNVTTTGSAATTTVSTGEGNDTVTLNAVGAGITTVELGAGDDRLVVTGGIDSIKTTDVLNGGDGTDALKIAGKFFDAEDYIILTDVVKGFETLELTTTAGTINASKLAGFTKFLTADVSSTFTGVAAAQTLQVAAGVTASAAGYVAPAGGAKSGTLAGTLNITADTTVATGAATITASAETVNLTISPATSNNDGASDAVDITLVGDAKNANVTFVAKTDTNGTASVTTDDMYETSNLIFTNADVAGSNDAMTTLTLSGNGSAMVTNVNNTALVTVNAGALASQSIAGKATSGLTYTTTNTASETITLGSGMDDLSITGSSFLKSDTITGLNLVDDAAVGGLQVDMTKSDALSVTSSDGTVLNGFVKTTTSAVSLNLALVDLAASAAGDKLVFQLGGDTYIYGDVAANGGAGDNILNDSDVLVKLTGAVDLDLLVSALG